MDEEISAAADDDDDSHDGKPQAKLKRKRKFTSLERKASYQELLKRVPPDGKPLRFGAFGAVAKLFPNVHRRQVRAIWLHLEKKRQKGGDPSDESFFHHSHSLNMAQDTKEAPLVSLQQNLEPAENMCHDGDILPSKQGGNSSTANMDQLGKINPPAANWEIGGITPEKAKAKECIIFSPNPYDANHFLCGGYPIEDGDPPFPLCHCEDKTLVWTLEKFMETCACCSRPFCNMCMETEDPLTTKKYGLLAPSRVELVLMRNAETSSQNNETDMEPTETSTDTVGSYSANDNNEPQRKRQRGMDVNIT